MRCFSPLIACKIVLFYYAPYSPPKLKSFLSIISYADIIIVYLHLNVIKRQSINVHFNSLNYNNLLNKIIVYLYA